MRLSTGYHVGETALFVTLRVNQRKQNWIHLQPQPRGRLSKRTPIPSFFTHFVTFFCMSSALRAMEWTSATPMMSRIRTVTRIDLVKPFFRHAFCTGYVMVVSPVFDRTD
jgi:hypothetical protein